MKKIILGTFESRPGAQTLIQYLQKDLNLPKDDISYIYRDPNGEVYEVDGEGTYEPDEELSREVKAGALIGGVAGMCVGFGMLLGMVPLLGPVFDTNPLVKAVGLTVSALGSLAVGALVGAIIGGLITSLFTGSTADEEDEKSATGTSSRRSDILVVAHARNELQVGKAFALFGASGVEIYTPTLSA